MFVFAVLLGVRIMHANFSDQRNKHKNVGALQWCLNELKQQPQLLRAIDVGGDGGDRDAAHDAFSLFSEEFTSYNHHHPFGQWINEVRTIMLLFYLSK